MAKTAAVRARNYDSVKVLRGLVGQLEALRAAVHRLCADPAAGLLLERPTGVGEWRVRELLAELAVQLELLPRQAAQPVVPSAGAAGTAGMLTPAAWAAVVGRPGGQPDSAARALAAERFAGPPAEVAAAFDAAVDALFGVLADPGRRVVAVAGGSMTEADFLVTRLVVTVLSADDLATALELPDFPHDRFARASAVRLLADAFAQQHPGGAVELRIPPLAVVQAVAGPRHTRGTPPNVVEMAPPVWLRVATGRRDWAAAVAAAEVSASGERSDLGALLPVLR
ncbi:sterol carrier family protein [Kitasatospora sp. LaBMicrA B282]|uniref:sterol carrier family protein n=1 Tax=Kitasatospora sp. LaBMicrA B282 TaxID=3420949 RepID=UPI003D0B0D16